MRNQKGFTLIELVVVIVVLGILAAVAVPKYVDLKTDAQIAQAEGVLGAAQSAASLNFASRLIGRISPLPDPITNGTRLLAAMEEVPDGWAPAGRTLRARMGGVWYIIRVENNETATTKAVLSKNW